MNVSEKFLKAWLTIIVISLNIISFALIFSGLEWFFVGWIFLGVEILITTAFVLAEVFE